MAKKPDSCVNCQWAKWHTTKSGRQDWHTAGFCIYKIPQPVVPKAFTVYIPDRSSGIWLNSPYMDCPCFLAIPECGTYRREK